MIIKPKFLATGIGSMPFDDPGYGIDLLLSTISEAPLAAASKEGAS